MNIYSDFPYHMTALNISAAINEGYTASAEFINPDLDFIDAAGYTDINFTANILGQNITLPTFSIESIQQRPHKISITARDGITKKLQKLVQGMTAAASSSTAAVLSDMAAKADINIEFAGYTSRPAIAPGDSDLYAINILQDYCCNFGSAWRIDGDSLTIFDIDFTAPAGMVEASEAVLNQDNDAYCDSISIQGTLKTQNRITISNGADTTNVQKKLTNPNAPQENVIADETGNIRPGATDPDIVRTLYPSDVWIDPWTKTLQRIYVPVATPYFRIPAAVNIPAGKYKCRYFSGSAQGWKCHFFKTEPLPDDVSTITIDSAGDEITIPEADDEEDQYKYARIQRTITVSTGPAVEFPHAAGIECQIIPADSETLPTRTYPDDDVGSSPDSNVITSAAYDWNTSDSTFDFILSRLLWLDNINYKTLDITTENFSYRIGDRIQWGSLTGIITALNFSFSAGKISAAYKLALNSLE